MSTFVVIGMSESGDGTGHFNFLLWESDKKRIVESIILFG